MVVAPALLALLFYVRHLRDGYLADDFLYVEWAHAGLGVLLRHVTTASNPQMIRPLPALSWAASRSAWGAAALHCVSVLLHAAAGLLLAAVIRRGRRARRAQGATGAGTASAVAAGAGAAAEERWIPAVFAALFVAFPLLTEPVIWLSASPDLWACCLALAALWAAIPTGDGRTGRAAAAAVLYLGALLSKESALTLPLIVAVLWPWRQVRRTVLLMAAAAGAYLAVRVVIFAGLGGYLDSGGRSVLWSPNLVGLLRSLALRLPLRVLAPVRRAGELRFAVPLTVLLSAALIGAFLLASFGRAGAPPLRRALSGLARLGRPLLVLALGLVPVLPILDIGIDQEGSRLLYLPAAMGLAALGLAAPGLGTLARRAALTLVALWSAATVWNGRAWSAAAWEVERTLAEMARLAPGFPARSMVFVAGHDIWHGAYTWRNAIAAAARLRGLRPDLSWFLGTVAGVDAPGNDLGRRLFEIGLDASGHAVDWTPCERALLRPPGTLLGSWTWPTTLGRDPVTPEVALGRPVALLQARIGLGERRPAAPVQGALFWLPPRFGRFNSTEAASFFFGPRAAAEIVVRVPPELLPPPEPMSRLGFWLHLPAEDLAYARSLSLAAAPPLCSAPPRL